MEENGKLQGTREFVFNVRVLVAAEVGHCPRGVGAMLIGFSFLTGIAP